MFTARKRDQQTSSNRRSRKIVDSLSESHSSSVPITRTNKAVGPSKKPQESTEKTQLINSRHFKCHWFII
jgi:hypothetical protein